MVLKSGKLRADLELFHFKWAIDYKFVAKESR